MKVIVYSNKQTDYFIDQYIAELLQEGYEIIKEFSNEQAPSFHIVKNDKIGYSLYGKKDYGTILKWLKDYHS